MVWSGVKDLADFNFETQKSPPPEGALPLDHTGACDPRQRGFLRQLHIAASSSKSHILAWPHCRERLSITEWLIRWLCSDLHQAGRAGRRFPSSPWFLLPTATPLFLLGVSRHTACRSHRHVRTLPGASSGGASVPVGLRAGHVAGDGFVP